MLYSLKEEIGHQDEIEERRDRDQKTKAQIKIKKNKLRDNTIILTPCPHLHPNMNQPGPPPLTYPIAPSFIITIYWTQNSWYK